MTCFIFFQRLCGILYIHVFKRLCLIFTGVLSTDSDGKRHFCAHKDQWSWYDQQQRQIEVIIPQYNNKGRDIFIRGRPCMKFWMACIIV